MAFQKQPSLPSPFRQKMLQLLGYLASFVPDPKKNTENKEGKWQTNNGIDRANKHKKRNKQRHMQLKLRNPGLT